MDININGKIFDAEEGTISFDDRSFRYGDGLFETMKIVDGKILLESFHFDRLLRGLNILKFEIGELFLADKFYTEIIQLCEKNNCLSLARVRLTLSRGDGNLYDFTNPFNYVIEARSLTEKEQSNEGITIGVFPDARKSCDIFSNLKSSNFLPYVMAAKFAIENEWDDCLVLNVHGRICDSTISNVFWVKDEMIFTPPLSEGCIDGVMRRFLLEMIRDMGYEIRELACEIIDLQYADEIFLTNAIRGIRPVKRLAGKIYSTKISKVLSEHLATSTIQFYERKS